MTSPYLTRQLERWARPNAHLFVRPDWRRFVPCDQDDHPFALYENKYRPNQPRVPAGSREGGQWTADGAGGGSRSPGSQPTTRPAPINDPRVISDAVPDNGWKPGAQYAQGPQRPVEELGRASSYGRNDGHHYAARAVMRDAGVSEEALRVLEKSKTGHLYETRSNRWDKAHLAYNQAVKEALDNYLAKNNTRPENMTTSQAREFLGKLLTSSDKRIVTYNKTIMMREIIRRLRFRIGRE